MNVRNSYPTAVAPIRFDRSTAGRASETGKVDANPHLSVVSDRVVISYRARAALNEMRKMPEVDLSIKALLNAAPLTEKRAGEVLSRIRQGYYKQPEILQKMAAVLSSVLEQEP